ncbi:hypothetical protein ACE0DR_25960 [Azotobacter sp. CWF10]
MATTCASPRSNHEGTFTVTPFPPRTSGDPSFATVGTGAQAEALLSARIRRCAAADPQSARRPGSNTRRALLGTRTLERRHQQGARQR